MIDFTNISPSFLTKKEVLCHTTPEAIFYHYFGRYKLGKCYSSPLRKDKDPSFGFYYNKSGELTTNDLTTSEKLDCIAFVGRLYEISYKDALQKIVMDFNIFCSNDGMNVLKTNRIITNSSLYSDKIKRETKIQIVQKEFSEQELDYWSRWNISEEELEKNDIFSFEKVYINGEVIPSKEEIKFAYYQKELGGKKGYFKIYQPFSKKYKWISNIPLNLPFGIDNLPFLSDTLVITKGQKDRLILLKLFTDVVATQNESTSAILKCLDISKKYKRIVVIYDADPPGVAACTEITELYNWEYFNTPNYLYKEKGIKDIAEYEEAFGIKSLIKRLKEKKIL